MTGVCIEKIAPVRTDDPQGNVFELFKGKPGLQVTVFERKAGVVCGKHFHKGTDPSKDPEYLFLISGECRVHAYNGFTDETLEKIVSAGTLLTFEKGIYHELEALTDIIFLEYRSTVFDPEYSDTFLREEYDNYIHTTKTSA